MDLIYADLELFNSDDLALQRWGYLQSDQVRHITIKALVDSGAYMLAINEDIAIQLGLPKLDEQDVVINPRQQTLVVNPQTPYIPQKPLKSCHAQTRPLSSVVNSSPPIPTRACASCSPPARN